MKKIVKKVLSMTLAATMLAGTAVTMDYVTDTSMITVSAAAASVSYFQTDLNRLISTHDQYVSKYGSKAYLSKVVNESKSKAYVSEVQRAMNYLASYYGISDRISVDGFYGNASKSMVKKIQSKMGITADGYFGPGAYSATISKLKSIFGMSSTSSSGYNPSASITYANNNAYSGQGLCAEYVSRCIQAGGISIPVIKGCGSLYRKLDSMGNISKYKLTVDSSGKILPQKNNCPITSGDVIIIYCSRTNEYEHAVLVGDVTNNGLYVYAHNRAYKNGLYWGFNYCGTCKRSSGTTAYLFHFE